MSRRDIGTPQALAAIERARKLLNRAYDKSSVRAEREAALAAATRTLAPFGLTVEDLKEDSMPEYLTAIKNAPGKYNERAGVHLAQTLAAGGWRGQNPRSEIRGTKYDKTETED